MTQGFDPVEIVEAIRRAMEAEDRSLLELLFDQVVDQATDEEIDAFLKKDVGFSAEELEASRLRTLEAVHEHLARPSTKALETKKAEPKPDGTSCQGLARNVVLLAICGASIEWMGAAHLEVDPHTSAVIGPPLGLADHFVRDLSELSSEPKSCPLHHV